MLKQMTVTGMVLSSMPIGDYDKRISILTKELGKISAFTKGARKPNSPLLAVSQPFSFGEFALYEGRSSYTVMSAKISNYFTDLRNDITDLCYGMYFCEFTDYMTREGNDEKEVLKLLYQSLKAISNPQIGKELVRYIFDLKLISINGEGPQAFECVKCGEEQDSFVFSVAEGGIICSQCRGMVSDAMKLSDTLLYTLQFVISQPIEKLYTFTLKSEFLYEFGRLVDLYRKRYIGHEMKSLEMLKDLGSYT